MNILTSPLDVLVEPRRGGIDMGRRKKGKGKGWHGEPRRHAEAAKKGWRKRKRK